MNLDTALDLVRVATPFITLLLLLIMGVIGWLIPFLFSQQKEQIKTLKTDLTADVDSLKKDLTEKMEERGCRLDKRIDGLEKAVRGLEQSRMADQKYMMENFVINARFMAEVGSTSNLFDNVFKRTNELNGTLNRLIGKLDERNKL